MLDSDTAILDLVRVGHLEPALEELLALYGEEVASFLRATLRSSAQADDAFALFLESAWEALPRFQARCSLRTWCYTLARHARGRVLRDPHARPERHAGTSQLDNLAEKLRSRTATFQRTETRDAIAALRSELDPDEQTLLLLRIDRRMSWNDIALITLDDAHAEREVVGREAAKLRKRFEVIKQRLRDKARRLGLLGAASREE